MGIERLAPDLVDGLGRPDAYPDDPTAAAGVECLQTHLSHLFLTQARVVKLRKAIKLPFVDFSVRASRVADCQHEIALNRRLAPDVYLGVAPVQRSSGHFIVRERWEQLPAEDPSGELPECVVVMRRLEQGRDALTLLDKGSLSGEDLDAVATTLARFHNGVGLGCPAPWEPEDWWEHCFRPVADTLASLQETRAAGLSAKEIEALSATMHDRFEALRSRLEDRRREGRAVDGHGDVHLQHIWFERHAPTPVLIDCVEFDANLRRIDAANEVAFLAMDLSYRGRCDLAARFLRKYANERDDFGLFAVVDAYQGYRAAVRAKVAALASVDSGIPSEQQAAASESAGRHLTLAAEASRQREPGPLVLVCGTVGVGKSTVAETLAERAGGVVISSDRTRKRLAGTPPDEHRQAAPDQGLYTPGRTEVVYRALLDRADAVVASGRVAIVDATFARAEHRARARAWAERRGVAAYLLEVQCSAEVARERLRRRSALGTDPSDAGPDFVEPSRSKFDPPTEWPTHDRYELRTDRDAGRDPLRPLVARLVRAP